MYDLRVLKNLSAWVKAPSLALSVICGSYDISICCADSLYLTNGFDNEANYT